MVKFFRKDVVSMIGDNIRKYRKNNNMSQDELAEKLEVTRQSVSLWENGQTQPSLDNIIALAKIFSISTDDLLTSNGEEIATVIEEKDNTPNEKNSKKKIIAIACIIAGAIILTLTAGILFGNYSEKKDVKEEVKVTATDKNDPKAKRDSKKETDSTAAAETTGSADAKETSKQGTPAAETAAPVTPTQESDYTPVTTKAPDNTPATKTPASTTAQPKPPAVTQSPVQATPDFYGYFKNYVVTNGILNGDYSYISNSSDKYGGLASEDFTMYYWGDTDTVEFCLHSVLDETFSVNFYLRIPKTYNGTIEYISSYYYRSNGAGYCEAVGTINAAEFTSSYPLTCTGYNGPSDIQNDFMEMSRVGICDALRCLKNFLTVEKLQYSLSDLGFKKFS